MMSRSSCLSSLISQFFQMPKQRSRLQHVGDQRATLELVLAFKTFTKHRSNSQFLLRIDNTTAISYINRMGGFQFPHFIEVTKLLWQWCSTQSLFVFASYIRSSVNKIANEQSRCTQPHIKWQLADYVYRKREFISSILLNIIFYDQCL